MYRLYSIAVEAFIGELNNWHALNDASRLIKVVINLFKVDLAVQIWIRNNIWTLYCSHLFSFQVKSSIRQLFLANNQRLTTYITLTHMSDQE